MRCQRIWCRNVANVIGEIILVLSDSKLSQFKLVIAKYRFSSDIVKTLRIYYFMLLEHMCKVFEIIDHPESEEIINEKKVKKEVKHGIHMAVIGLQIWQKRFKVKWFQTVDMKF